jgi:murein DD-endopeptidase MepM/ murein hydrolase activator NlpD
VARLQEEQRQALDRLRTWVVTHVEALEDVFASTGVDPEDLLARAADLDNGQGGPLRLVRATATQPDNEAALLDAEIDDAFGRMVMLQRLLASLPLAAPLERFRISSLYGERSDPFTRQAAIHEGMDFVAARDAEILAAGPGEVIYAGWAGAYGNMVEIDHGLGITTRYAHLKEVAVALGDDVAVRQPIGIIGSTGRSTGRHLHYEVRIDGDALDPANFLNAGARLAYAFE